MTSTPKRQRFQVSLWTLFVVVTMACIVLGWAQRWYWLPQPIAVAAFFGLAIAGGVFLTWFVTRAPRHDSHDRP